ncbi:uncharacterized protein LOC118744669 [Rhagoletis pomonella]|uniref:uncharacterized protein LOC118744669 n=1 Tax=Rhagoletis pomonella TaxID=28610 RepID=UPI00177F13F3|nr:uncharacterized protein LOC118744669 [Rhagoletis pomonella]
MEMLKAPTIWESASRPLFVRSTWLEAPKTGRAGPQRHFILDYEPNQRRVYSKSAVSGSRNKAHATLQHSYSYDFASDWQNHRQCGFSEDSTTDLLLIVPAKVEPSPATTALTISAQQTQQKFTAKSLTASSRTHQKRATLFFSNHAVRRGPLHELYELYSRHSSLQDLQSTLSQANSHADERLAERVLNWLDLAGKRVDTQQAQPIDTIDMVKRPKKSYVKLMPSQAPPGPNEISKKGMRIANTQTQASAPPPPAVPSRSRKNMRNATSGIRAEQSPCVTATANQPAAHSRPSDPVKHITIIFDREGVPVRFNRPVRNIDLCTLSTSPATVRRLAGPLASARLYSEAEKCVANQAPPTTTKAKPPKPRTSDMEYGTFGTKASHKRPHDTGVFDAKKQLHIFMPSLPKKGLLTAVGPNVSGCGSVDDTLSGLSNTFSELCKI